MKIVHVCINSNVFGKDYSYQDNLLSRAHRKLGHEVFVIAPTYSEFDKKTGGIISEPVGEETLADGIKLIRLKPALPLVINHSVHCFFGLRQAIERINPDLVFAHGVTSLNFRYLKKLKKHHPEIKIVYDNHADFNNSCQSKLPYLYARYIVRHFVIRHIKDTSNFFYGVTPARCAFLRDMYGVPSNKISLLPMGADDDDMNLDNKEMIRKDVRNQYNILENDFLIVTGGKIDPLKNIHVLAQSVANCQNNHIKLLVFGSIRDDLKAVFDSIISKYPNKIIHIGWIPSNEVYRYFYAADMVIFPGLHSVLWEQAVASKVPCAFSRISGFEHVDIGGNCVLMEGKNVEYYQSLIERLYTDRNYYDELYNNSQSARTSEFLYSHIAIKVLNDVGL